MGRGVLVRQAVSKTALREFDSLRPSQGVFAELTQSGRETPIR
jgi:hypothetical protein